MTVRMLSLILTLFVFVMSVNAMGCTSGNPGTADKWWVTFYSEKNYQGKQYHCNDVLPGPYGVYDNTYSIKPLNVPFPIVSFKYDSPNNCCGFAVGYYQYLEYSWAKGCNKFYPGDLPFGFNYNQLMVNCNSYTCADPCSYAYNSENWGGI